MGTREPDALQELTHDNDRFAPPSSAQVNSTKRATKSHPTVAPMAAAPARRTFFDPWNSSSTGHQRAENRLSGSTSWRTSRSLKLGEQYKSGLTGGKRVADTVGAGSEGFGKDGRKENGGWEKGAKGLRIGGQPSLAEIWSVNKVGKKPIYEKESLLVEHNPGKGSDRETDFDNDNDDSSTKLQEKQIFEGLCFYVNGSTAPLVSDHKLKHLLSMHGAQHSIVLGRRTVTHVILGVVNGNGGAGGGLAASKLQKEIARTRGKAVKYVTVEWVLESLKAGRRLPEARFAPLKLAQKTQNSVFTMMDRHSATRTVHG